MDELCHALHRGRQLHDAQRHGSAADRQRALLRSHVVRRQDQPGPVRHSPALVLPLHCECYGLCSVVLRTSVWCYRLCNGCAADRQRVLLRSHVVRRQDQPGPVRHSTAVVLPLHCECYGLLCGVTDCSVTD